jgi:hypothetical protein
MQLKIEKEKYRVIIMLDNMTIIGNIHLTPRSRLTDVLNSNQIKDFIPITDAEIETYNTGQKQFIDLIEVNKNKINAIYPIEDNT